MKINKEFIAGVLGLIVSRSVYATIPREELIIDRVEIQEYNTLYNKNNDIQLEQMIYWNSCNDCKNYHSKVVDWRFVKTISIIPVKNNKTGKYESFFYDGNRLRKVESNSYLRTLSNYDPEVKDRKTHNYCKRKGLSNSK